MRHVREQVVEAAVSRILAGVPELGGRCWRNAPVGWDGRSFPTCVVSGARTKAVPEPGTDGAILRRDTELVVEIEIEGFDGEDYADAASSLAIAVERIIDGLPDDVPVESVVFTGDTGVHEMQRTGRGLRAGIALSFSARFYTHRGDAARFATPEN